MKDITQFLDYLVWSNSPFVRCFHSDGTATTYVFGWEVSRHDMVIEAYEFGLRVEELTELVESPGALLYTEDLDDESIMMESTVLHYHENVSRVCLEIEAAYGTSDVRSIAAVSQ